MSYCYIWTGQMKHCLKSRADSNVICDPFAGQVQFGKVIKTMITRDNVTNNMTVITSGSVYILQLIETDQNTRYYLERWAVIIKCLYHTDYWFLILGLIMSAVLKIHLPSVTEICNIWNICHIFKMIRAKAVQYMPLPKHNWIDMLTSDWEYQDMAYDVCLFVCLLVTLLLFWEANNHLVTNNNNQMPNDINTTGQWSLTENWYEWTRCQHRK